MNILKRGIASLGAALLLCVITLIIILAANSIRMGVLPEPRGITRVIIFTEVGNDIFEVEKRDTRGITLETLYTPRVIDALKTARYEVSMAVDTFSPAMAAPVKKLNRAGVKVWVWPLHPIEDGYWLATDNADKFPALYERFKKWTVDNGIKVHGLMLDIEPTYQSVQRLKEAVKKGGIGSAIGHLLGDRNVGLRNSAVKIYSEAIAKMRRDGFEVSTFNIPYVMDDRLDGDDSVQEMFHVAFVESDIDIYMLYRSYFTDSGLGKGTANVVSYARSLGGGSAGIGNYMHGYIAFEDFADDLRIAARWSPVVHIYNLESLVFRNWLGRIASVDVRAPVESAFSKRLIIAGYRLFFLLIDLFTGASAIWVAGAFMLVWLGLWRPWRALSR